MKLILKDWLERIDQNFEKFFWIDQSNSDRFVDRRNIYKDTINSTFQWTDFQFRPNFLVAAVVLRTHLSSSSSNIVFNEEDEHEEDKTLRMDRRLTLESDG